MKEKSVIFFDIYYPAFYILFLGRLQYQIPSNIMLYNERQHDHFII